ncbi:MAG: FG-GAP-like repeat-containing protein, partial [Bacteroidota bacterium]
MMRLILLMLMCAGPVLAQPFRAVETNLPGLVFGAIELADIDLDGRLDVIVTRTAHTDTTVTGNPSLRVHLNRGLVNGRLEFEEVQRRLDGYFLPSLNVKDIDGDSDVDIVVSGRNDAGRLQTSIYENTSAGTLQLASALSMGLPGASKNGGILEVVNEKAMALADLDNDGDLDAVTLVSGASMLGVFRNDGNAFTEIAGVPNKQAVNGILQAGDVDNDGDIDILVADRRAEGTPETYILVNEGNFVFSVLDAGLPGVDFGSVTWADMDNDGDLDVLVSGGDVTPESGEAETQVQGIYRNDNGTFNRLDVPFGLHSTFVDFDNDGDLDVLSNTYSEERNLHVFLLRNDGTGQFDRVPEVLPGVWWGAIKVGDLDNDGDMDVLLAGEDLGGSAGKRQGDDDVQAPFLRMYLNEASAVNNEPAPPQDLQATFLGDQALFEWTPGLDAETSVAGLTYNLRVGTTPGGDDVLASASHTSGIRMVSAPGNVGHNLAWTVNGLDPNIEYFWSVQAVDA